MLRRNRVRLWILPVAWILSSTATFAQAGGQTAAGRMPDGQPDILSLIHI